MTSVTKIQAASSAIVPDAYQWLNPYGGVWSSASNWLDLATGTVPGTPPDASNAVTIVGGSGENFTSILGTGAAAQLTIAQEVLIWGTLSVVGAVAVGASGDLELESGASVTAGNLTLASAAQLQVGGTLKVAGAATLTNGFLDALNGGLVQVGTLIGNGINAGYRIQTGIVAVDDISAIEVGTAGGAALGAVTIDHGFSAALTGSIDGNLVVNGALGVQAFGHLAIDISDPFGTAQSIAGSGTITLSEDSVLTLGQPDSAAIRFGGPAGTLDVTSLPSGVISGFGAGDVIEIAGGSAALATGLSYAQTSNSIATLTLTKGGKSVGTLSLAGNYAGSLFHLSLDVQGDGLILVQTVGSAPAQPTQILGTAGMDTVNATANSQTITGLGGNDTLSAGGYSGIDFKDTSADLNGSAITGFASSSTIDLTDMKLASVTISYVPGTPGSLIVTDGTHAATIGLAFAPGMSAGYFNILTDGLAGTGLTYTAVNTDAYTYAAATGGAYTTASNWQDTTTGAKATAAPSYGNALTIAGKAAAFTGFTGTGQAASITTSGNVLLLGNLSVGTKVTGVSGALNQTGTLALDVGARLLLTGTAGVGGVVEVGNGSTLTSQGGLDFTSNIASVLVTGGSVAQFAALSAGAGYPAFPLFDSSVIGVDPTSSIELGSAGGAVAGALTIDSGVTANLGGTIAGNVVVNGILSVAGTLAIAPFAMAAASVSGTGTIQLTAGDSLSLSAADSAAIQFSPLPFGGSAANTETLALTGALPTGTISGFGPGDVITVGRTVTGLSYSQTGATGQLTLLNGTAAAGTLVLSGTYTASQFQVQPSAATGPSVITFAAGPSTVAGNQVSGGNDAYVWTNVPGGLWSNIANWTDATAGGAAVSAPGWLDAVTVNDTTGAWTQQIISGTGSASALTVSGAANTVFTGNLTIGGQFTVNTYGSGLTGTALEHGATLSVGSLVVESPLAIGGASSIAVAGTGNGTFISGALTVTGGSTVKVAAGSSTVTGTVGVDATSSLEFGASGGAALGAVTIDAGQSVIMQGVGTFASNLVVNGGLLVYPGTIKGFAGSVGSIKGTGTISIGALGPTGSLILNASDTAAIAFMDYYNNGVPAASESLEFKGPLPVGLISGFIAGDSFIVDTGVTGASWTQTIGTRGTLTLTNGQTAAGTLTLLGNYAADLFQVDVAAGTGIATISMQAIPSTTGSAAASTGKDAYAWTGANGGSWANAANWRDTTTGTVPGFMPGGGDAVTIAGTTAAGQYTTIGGTGTAASLTTSGNVLMTSQLVVAGAVHVGSGAGPAPALALDAGAKFTVGGTIQIMGRMEVEGGSSTSIGGYAMMMLGGSLLALSGGSVLAGGLIGCGGGATIAIDASSSIRIGASAPVVANALSIAAGAPAAFNGSIFAGVVDNGTLSVAAGGSLFIDMVGTAESDPYAISPQIAGTGTLVLTEGSTLGLGAPDIAAIQFAGPNATLMLAALPNATISGFTAGDAIQVDQPVTGMIYKQTTTTSATLTLTDGANTVGVLKLAGSYGGGLSSFHLDVGANGDTATISLQSLLITPGQPSLLQGTVGPDLLTATANGQTMTGLGGGDTLNAGGFTGIDFRDFTAYLSGSTIQNFGITDMIDFTDMSTATATASYASGMLSVTDGIHVARSMLGFASTPATGSFHTASDGSGGTKLTWS